jgi:hypothetical protein
MKNGLDKLQYQERTAARARIAEIEAQETHYRMLADQKAGNKKSSEAKSITPAFTNSDSEKQTAQNLKVQADKPGIIAAAPDTGKSRAKSIQPDILSMFEINQKPVIKAGEMVPVNPETPKGLVYRIQVAVLRNRVAISFFKGIAPAYGYKIQGTDKTTYYLGIFRKSSDARKALESVKKRGFRDAFVVASMDGKPVSAVRAAVLEKEWGNKPLKQPEAISQQTPADTVPPVLTFRVELKRSAKPLKDDVVEEMRKIAGNRSFDIMETENKQMIYLIGNFITFESASEYADLLVRNGYHDAKVVAWIGKKEIPVDTARQLFDKIQ